MSEISTAKEAGRYEIRLKGHLDNRWAIWFDGMTLTTNSEGTTTLDGIVVDKVRAARPAPESTRRRNAAGLGHQDRTRPARYHAVIPLPTTEQAHPPSPAASAIQNRRTPCPAPFTPAQPQHRNVFQ